MILDQHSRLHIQLLTDPTGHVELRRMAHPLDQQNDTREIHRNVVRQEFLANSRTLFNQKRIQIQAQFPSNRIQDC